MEGAGSRLRGSWPADCSRQRPFAIRARRLRASRHSWENQPLRLFAGLSADDDSLKADFRCSVACRLSAGHDGDPFAARSFGCRALLSRSCHAMLAQFPTEQGDCSDSSVDACDESARHGRHSSPTNCEDSCFACRFLAAKSIVPAVVLPVERFETVCQLEAPPPAFAPVTQLECSLCRGPPALS